VKLANSKFSDCFNALRCGAGLACFLLIEAEAVAIPHPSADVSGRAPERRIHHRVLVGASAWLLVAEQRFSAPCVNLSMGGAALGLSLIQI
jgi:hypothetical protein